MDSTKNNTMKKILEIIDSIRPYLNYDGGDIEFVKYEDNIVYVKLLGGCNNCMFADETLQNSVFETLKQQIPEIKAVIKVDF